ncbi:RNA polymerase sigma factor [Nonomuraea roseoviolacea subsp. roseoviolacea]|uniref:RNA polymerase sigma-70 factor (ECF subfamily) n=1 Tax=Nonomuraea roseoviolacea subsp. carminata TaxID=160689 RepID=A0ABT1K1F9_9ACTN|nr:RNA polymerase sigma factor [Nonomuraea roseoviolacea]MCP2347836.1 RNA polymerase sigma-70 factor (ECF subfamily) [Nonomuraea roseoviolacea subsp. carminata]
MTAPPEVGDPLTQAADDAVAIVASVREPERFATLYDRYFEEIYRYLAVRVGPEAADDMAAETFLTAFRKRHTFDPDRGAVRPWLYGIATNLVALHRRGLSRMLAAFRRAPRADEVEAGLEDRVTTRVDAAGARGPLAAALAGLSRGDRDVLLLVALAGLTYEEVAESLRIPYGTVASRLSRARRKVRAVLGDVNPMNGDADG